MKIEQVVEEYMAGVFTLGDVQFHLLDILTPENVEEVLLKLPNEVRFPTLDWMLKEGDMEPMFTKEGWKTVPANAVAAARRIREVVKEGGCVLLSGSARLLDHGE